MIPSFPQFKRLELADQADVEAITSKFQPYSHMDFTCLWSWDVNDDTMVSILNGNLVVIISDHFSKEPFYTFLGNEKINETIEALFTSAKEKNMPEPAIRMVPEASLLRIDFNRFFIEIDLDACDYIYDIRRLATYEGAQYRDKRQMYNRFLRSYPGVKPVVLDIHNPDTRNTVLGLNHLWIEGKTEKHDSSSLEREISAIERFINSDFKNTLTTGVLYENKLIAYSTFTLLQKGYVMCHFAKADTDHPGIYEYLMRQNAIILQDKGYKYLNYQEDLGLSGLRYAKTSFRPTGFLRKYYVKMQDAKKSAFYHLRM
jgi:uncharacterized protein